MTGFKAYGSMAPIVAIMVGFLLLLASSLYSAEVTVFAAASLTDALKKLAAQYKTPDRILFNFGASSLLARQIEEGAPADIFFSADEAKMDGLEKKALILSDSRKSLLSNLLVIAVAAHGGPVITRPQDLVSGKIQRLALAEPGSVPAGIYAREYLEQQHLWASVKAKVIPTENVRAALAAVEAGNADAAIVYKTDALISREVRIAYEIPASDTPQIRYSIAVIKQSQHVEAAKAFLGYLSSAQAARIFVKFGFIVRQ